ncbi:MAG TPA: DnaA regulatory inactivator Hda [Gammaproteobacteria bacterium]|nr:DnaA regulatory inactivator Hda [Gammaproteobacteria bacterium]
MSAQLPLSLRLRPAARFENFVVGSNGELLAQLRAMSQAARGVGECFLFLRGRAGSGRSHLMQACCHAVSARGGRAAYVPLSEHETLQPGLLEGWERFDLVCLDDVDAIAGRSPWEEALFHLYNQVRESGGRLLASARVAPEALDIGLPDLLSRLGWGPVYALEPLDEAGRIEALRLRARYMGLELPGDTVSWLMRHMPRDLPALLGLLERLDEASLVAQRRLTVPFVKSVLAGKT